MPPVHEGGMTWRRPAPGKLDCGIAENAVASRRSRRCHPASVGPLLIDASQGFLLGFVLSMFIINLILFMACLRGHESGTNFLLPMKEV